MDRVPPLARVGQNSRERQRDLAGARAHGRAAPGGAAPRPVHRLAAETGAGPARAAAQLLALQRARHRALSGQHQAGTPWRRRGLHRRRAAHRRRGGCERATGRLHASAGRRPRGFPERRHRRDARAGNAPRLGGWARRRGKSGGSMAPATAASIRSPRRRARSSRRSPMATATFATARPIPRIARAWISTLGDAWT